MEHFLTLRAIDRNSGAKQALTAWTILGGCHERLVEAVGSGLKPGECCLTVPNGVNIGAIFCVVLV